MTTPGRCTTHTKLTMLLLPSLEGWQQHLSWMVVYSNLHAYACPVTSVIKRGGEKGLGVGWERGELNRGRIFSTLYSLLLLSRHALQLPNANQAMQLMTDIIGVVLKQPLRITLNCNH